MNLQDNDGQFHLFSIFCWLIHNYIRSKSFISDHKYFIFVDTWAASFFIIICSWKCFVSAKEILRALYPYIPNQLKVSAKTLASHLCWYGIMDKVGVSLPLNLGSSMGCQWLSISIVHPFCQCFIPDGRNTVSDWTNYSLRLKRKLTSAAHVCFKARHVIRLHCPLPT